MEHSNCVYCMSPAATDVCPQCGRRGNEYAPAPHQLIPGTVLSGKYVVGAVLGEGGFGITYIGRDINLDLRVAIKEYFPSGLVNRNHTASAEVTAHYGDAQGQFEKGKKSFLGEARTLAKFSDDPSIVSVRDFFSENNTAYIVMEYLEGINLQTYLQQNGAMDFHQAVAMLSPVMTALSKVHAQGLIHRDISPANIMVMKNGTVKLLDFGAARDVGGSDEKSLSIMLKPGYAPEEQYRTRGKQGPWTDVYALSATMYKLVTGTTPENAMNRIFQSELKAPSAINGRITAEQDRVILKGMAVQSEDRYQSAAELQSACQAALAPNRDEVTYTPGMERTVIGSPLVYGEKSKTPIPVQPVAATPAPAPLTPIQSVGGQSERTSRASQKQVVDEESAQSSQTPYDGKKPNKAFLILSAVTGFVSLLLFNMLVANVASSDTETSTNVIAAIFLVFLIGATVLLGWRYYPLARNKKRKPRIFCLVTSVIATLGAASWTVIAYMLFADPYRDEGTAELAVSMIASMLVIAAFFGYFYYPRLPKKFFHRAMKIYGGVFAALVVSFVGYIVFVSLSTITVGDTKISRNETEVYLSLDIINNNDLAKLKELKKLESLAIIGCFLDDEDVKLIGELTQLRELSLQANTDITDVSSLNNLKNLVYLDLSYTNTGDITCLTNLTGLKTLYLSGTKVRDLSILETYTSLEILEIDSLSELDASTIALPTTVRTLHCENDGLESVGFLSGVESLHNFYAAGNQISDIAPMEKFEELYIVNLSGNNISDISPVCQSGLYELKLNDNSISDISALTGVRMTTLELGGNQISDISALADNSNLRFVDLSRNSITDISALRDCFNIYSLDLSYNSIADITAIATIDNLSLLKLRGNQIVDISPLAEAKNLVNENGLNLDLRDNEIESLQPLSTFDKLKSLYISGNRISDVSPLASCSALSNLDLNFNNVSDIAPLAALESLHTLELVGNPIENLSAISLNPDSGVFGGTSLARGILHITYNDAIDWQALKTAEHLSVTIYDVTDRQKANLQELGFYLFASSSNIGADESPAETGGQDG